MKSLIMKIEHLLFAVRLATFLLLSLSLCAVLKAAEIDDTRLQAARQDHSSWLHYGRDYTHQRFSKLDQINRGNITRLKPKWTFSTGIKSSFQASPIIADGVMYVSTPFSNVLALDARSGTELWRYTHDRKGKKICCSPTNRGVAIGYGLVFIATVDAHLVALDQKTGKPVWDVTLSKTGDQPTEQLATLKAGDTFGDFKIYGSTGVGANMAPLVYDGKVFAGISGIGFGLHLDEKDGDKKGSLVGTIVGIPGNYGRAGFMAAFDARTGMPVWQFNTTKPGWEGDYVEETAYGEKLPRDIAKEKKAAKKHPESWRFGGGTVWHPPAVDKARGLLFFGIGNPAPQVAAESRPGDNLYTTALVAVSAATGKIVWHYQQSPHDLWGYDVASPPSLFDLEWNGKIVPAIGQASKLGWYFVHDRRDGKLLYKSPALVPQENLFKHPDENGVRIAPGPGGGTNWSPVSLDEATGRVYIASLHLPFFYQRKWTKATNGKPPEPYYIFSATTETQYGILSSLDLKDKGKILWQVKTEKPLIGGVLATSGGLLFTGEGNGMLSAFDSETGERLWQHLCGPGINAPPITFMLDGKQHIAIVAGGSRLWGFEKGDKVLVFALEE